MNQEDRTRLIEEYGRGFELLKAALAEIPAEAWEFKPSADDWSVHEVIVHMGDSESMAALRARKLIVEPGSQLMGYEESRWAGALDYARQDPQLSLDIIRLARQTTYDLLKRQPDDVFTHTVMHAEYSEPYTFDKWLSIYARHVPDHIDQMKKAAEAWKHSR